MSRTFQHVTKPAPVNLWVGDDYYPKGTPVTMPKRQAGCLMESEGYQPKKSVWDEFANGYYLPAGECIKVEIPVSGADATTTPCRAKVTVPCGGCVSIGIGKEPATPTAEKPVTDGSMSQNPAQGEWFDIAESMPGADDAPEVLVLCNKGKDDIACAIVEFAD